jgi:WD40 repeat protein
LLGHDEAVTTLAFSADGTRLATGNAGAVTMWNLAAGQAAWTRHGLGLFPRCITFSPDGRRLTACSTDRQTVPIWDAADGSEVLTLRGHSGPLQHVAFGPDGQRLFTYSSDRTVRVWDGVTGQEVLTLPLPDPVAMATVPCLAVSRDGKRLAALCKDHTIRVWNAGSPAAAHQHPTLGAYHLPDRRAAEWVLASGGSVDVISGGRTMVGVRDRADLPAANYRYRAISREP